MLAFCEKCHDMVEYTVEKKQKSKEIKGKLVIYEGKEPYCSKCGENIFVAETRDYNLNKLDEAYRESENLIKISDIKK